MFEYPPTTHQRRHGPQGYNDPKSFKPWLRDEFAFRCVYCLWRETWCVDGDGRFSVEHLKSQSRHPDLIREYDNLAYACCGCNSAKQDREAPVTVDYAPLAAHLKVQPDGRVAAKTAEGEQLIELCLLNRPAMVNARQTVSQLWELLNVTSTPEANDLKHRLFGFPTDLPNLARLHPPGGNTKPAGIASSHFERRQRGELPHLWS